jgi:hypothetical protein
MYSTSFIQLKKLHDLPIMYSFYALHGGGGGGGGLKKQKNCKNFFFLNFLTLIFRIHKN